MTQLMPWCGGRHLSRPLLLLALLNLWLSPSPSRAEPSAEPSAAPPALTADAVRSLLPADSKGAQIEVDPQGGSANVTFPRTDGFLTVSTAPLLYASGRHTDAGVDVAVFGSEGDERSARRLIRVAQSIVQRKGDGAVPSGRTLDDFPERIWMAAGLAVLLAVFVVRRAVRSGAPVLFELKRRSHIMQMLTQSTLFAYWSIYFSGVGVRLGWILPQLVLAFALDAITSMQTRREWRVGFGPLPVVFSINLGAWFGEWGSIVTVVVAFLSRMLVRYRGSHLLNPSAAGLTVAMVLALFFPAFEFSTVFRKFALAPNMGELVALLSLVPLLTFRLGLVSLGCGAALVLSKSFVDLGSPGLVFPTTLVTFTLLAGDPVTVPKRGWGRLLFGLFVGTGFHFVSVALSRAGRFDDLAKVLPVTVANLLVPAFDAFAVRFEESRLRFVRWLASPGTLRWNVVHVACWFALVVQSRYMMKPITFQMSEHWTYATPVVVGDAEGVPTCDLNPAFCSPFSFREELAAWSRRREALAAVAAR